MAYVYGPVWYYFRKVALGRGHRDWTAYVDPNNAHILAWHSAKPDASVDMWSYNDQLGWVHERAYTASDPAPFPNMSASSSEMPPPPPDPQTPTPKVDMTKLEIMVADVQAAANRRAIAYGTCVAVALATISAVVLLKRRRRRAQR